MTINVHTHDRNMSINKMMKDKGDVTNQNDSWHGVKSVKKAFKAISSGPKDKEGKTWSEQLYDKMEPVATHFHWAIRNCGEDPLLLSNNVSHYKNEHSNCHQTSRCKIDGNYEPTLVVVTDPKAEKMLRNAIESAVIFKSPGDYVLVRDTSYVESFNNVMNVFHDKRTAFSDQTYNVRAQLTVLDWNENADRVYTSISEARDS